MAETKMRAFLLLFGILQSSTGSIAPGGYLEYGERRYENYSIIYDENSEDFFPYEDYYDENSEDFFPYEDYYDDNSTYDYENRTVDHESFVTVKTFTNSAPLCHSPLFILTLLHILHFLQQDFQMGF